MGMALTWEMVAPALTLFGVGTLATALISYLLGCFNGAIVVSKYILRDDVRTHGSGNAGLTNFYRTFGGGLAFAVILSDMVKGVLAVRFGLLVFAHLGDPRLGMMVAALFVILGHMFPFMFAFRGGKGILTGGAVAILLDWRLALLVWGAFALPVLLTRLVSLGSIAAGAAFPVGVWLFMGHNFIYTTVGVVIGGLILWKHRDNFKRLIAGEERRVSFGKKKEGG